MSAACRNPRALPYGLHAERVDAAASTFMITLSYSAHFQVYSRRQSSPAGIRFYHIRSVGERAGDLDAAEHIPRRSMDGAD